MRGLRAGVVAMVLASSVAAGPTKAELQEQYQAVLKDLAAQNQKAAQEGSATSPEHRTRMMELISRMQQLQLAIAQAERAGAPPSPWDDMSATELEAERQRLMEEAKEASAAGEADRAAALYRQVTEVAKRYNLRLQQATTGTQTGASGEARVVTTGDAMRFFEQGEVERGLNAYEAILAGGLERENLGHAINLAGFYLDLVANAERCLEWAERVEDFVDQELGDTLGDLAGDAARRGLVGSRRSARQAQARALAALRRSRALEGHLAETRRQLEAERAAFPMEAGEGLEALEFHVLGDFQLATAHIVAAQLARSRDKDEEATAHGEAALELIQHGLAALAAHPDQDVFQVQNWTNLLLFRQSTVLLELGRIEEARASWRRYFAAEDIYGEHARQGHYYAVAKVDQARTLAAAGRLDEAIAAADVARTRYFGEGEQAKVAGPYQALAWKPSFLLGKLHEQRGDTAAALEHYRHAIEVIEGLYAKLRSGKLKGSFLSFDECGAAYDRVVAILLDQGRPAEALATLDRSKSAVILDMLRSQPLRDRSRWPQRLLERERELKRRLRRPSPAPGGSGAGTRAGATGPDPAARREALEDYELFLREVQQAVSARAEVPPEKRLDRVWARDAASLGAVGAGGRLVVAFFDDGAHVWAFLVQGGEVRSVKGGASRTVERAARKLRRNVTARSRRWTRPASKLYEALIEPWQDALEGARELVLVPTGELFAVPFAALPDAQERPLAARLPVSFVSQVSLLSEAGATGRSGRPAGSTLVLADPDGSLPHARVEGKLVAAAAGDRAEVIEGEEATEGGLKSRVGFLKQAPAPAALHLATHGLLDKGAHLLSSLVLAPDDLEDGALTFLEIFNELDLRETPVVVLSACNTAVGETQGGDEVVGLSRAFQYAGAAWVVASLWEVSDEASAFLMSRFHEALAAGEPVDRALKVAQDATRAERDEWAHPYYWAAFAAYRR